MIVTYKRTVLKVGVLMALLAFGILVSMVEGADFAVVDFPVKVGKGAGERFSAEPRQLMASDGMGYAEFSLKGAGDGEQLLVTVVFVEDAEGGGPSILWFGKDGGRQMTLSENLGDGVEGSNQRTVLVPGEDAEAGGRILLSGDQRKILRVRFDWTARTEVLVGADQKPVSVMLGDRAMQTGEVSGGRQAGVADAWRGDIFEASLQEEPQAMDGNVEVVAPLGDEPGDALLSASFLGLPLGGAVDVWVNGKKAGQLWPQAPSFTDPGYIKGAGGGMQYAGWRGGTLVVPAEYLHLGDNTLVLSAGAQHVYMKDALLQFRAGEAGREEPAAVDLDSLNQSLVRQ